MIAKKKQFNFTKNQNLKNNYLKLIFPYFSYQNNQDLQNHFIYKKRIKKLKKKYNKKGNGSNIKKYYK